MADWLAAIILGLVEGLTEFIPVSSTGHLLLTKSLLGLPNEPWDTFIVMIQLGAILAVVAVYFARLWKVLLGLPGKDPAARRFGQGVAHAHRAFVDRENVERHFQAGARVADDRQHRLEPIATAGVERQRQALRLRGERREVAICGRGRSAFGHAIPLGSVPMPGNGAKP